VLSFATMGQSRGILVFFDLQYLVAFLFIRFVKLRKWNMKGIYLGKFSV